MAILTYYSKVIRKESRINKKASEKIRDKKRQCWLNFVFLYDSHLPWAEL
jgi:hypothetical protein